MQQETHESNGAQTPQEAALAAAQKRLAQAPCSYRGLVRSLEAEGFSLPNAVYAADHCGADWERQAVLCVRRWLSEHPFPLRQLLARLMEEGFTEAQARYGASKNGY